MLHVMDCVCGMREHVADASVDLVITDPPYNIGVRGEAWDSMSAGEARTFTLAWLREAARILRPGGSLIVWGSPCRRKRIETCGRWMMILKLYYKICLKYIIYITT